jgi:hypothetical protein
MTFWMQKAIEHSEILSITLIFSESYYILMNFEGFL